jgi:hypothetical protein
MSHYGTSLGGGSCENDFGNGLIQRWRETRSSYCSPRTSPSSSSIDCFLVKQTRHHGNGDQLCLGSNIRLKYSDFADPRITDGVLKRYIDSKHMDSAYIHYSKGTWSGMCDLEASLWKKESFPGWNADWQQSFVPIRGDGDLQCDVWETKPTLLVQRDTFANMFHDSEDFFNTL